MRFSGVKIEKLMAIPAAPLPNQFYLVETGGGTKFYISDTESRLHLLNESPADLYVGPIGTITLTPSDSGSIITDDNSPSVKNVYLPNVADSIEYEFWVVYGNGLRLYTADGTQLIKIGTAHQDKLKSVVDSSALRIYAFNGHWRARSLVGDWETEEVVTYQDVTVIYQGDTVTYI